MKKAIIYYFSGTGTTEKVTALLKKEFLKEEYQVDVLRMEDILKSHQAIRPEEYDLIGIGCQVIGYGVPSIVHKFIKQFPKSNHQKVFIFRTAGGVAPVNFNASKPIIRKLNRKGYEVFHEQIFSIASNWIVKYDDEVVRQLYHATSRKVGIMCREIIEGKERILHTKLLLRIKMNIIMFIAPGLLMLVGKDLRANQSCTHCGLCIRNCPAGNISEKNGKINFKLSCNGCLRCIYACPKSAIHYRLFKFFPVPGGYPLDNILKQTMDISENLAQNDLKKPEIDTSKINGKIPDFFYDYINND